MIEKILLSIGLFLVILIIHELGHIIGYALILKRLPSIKINKFLTIYVGLDDDNITLRQLFIIAWLGILMGFMPLIFLNDYYWITLYILVCSIDIAVIVNYLHAEKKFRDIKLKYIKTVIAK